MCRMPVQGRRSTCGRCSGWHTNSMLSLARFASKLLKSCNFIPHQKHILEGVRFCLRAMPPGFPSWERGGGGGGGGGVAAIPISCALSEPHTY